MEKAAAKLAQKRELALQRDLSGALQCIIAGVKDVLQPGRGGGHLWEVAELRNGQMTGRWYPLSRCVLGVDGDTYDITIATTGHPNSRMAGQSASGIARKHLHRACLGVSPSNK